MQNLQAEPPLANTDLTDAEDVMEAAGDRLRRAKNEVIRSDAARGMADDVSVMFMQDPLKAELVFRDVIHDFARAVLGDAFERIDDHGDCLEVDGRTYRKVDATRGHAMTMFGPVGYDRARYRPSGGGASVFPTERVLGLTESSLTPAAAGLSLYLMANLSARESADAWDRLCGMGPSPSSLIQMTAEAGRRFEDCSGDLLADLRSEEEVHEDATALLVSLDGVMVRMNAETVDGNAVEAGWREASSGVVSLLDADGNMVQSSYFGRLPERGKTSLKAQVSREAFHWLERKEDLKVVAIADGARDNDISGHVQPRCRADGLFSCCTTSQGRGRRCFRSGQRGRRGLVREMAPRPSPRPQGGRKGHRRAPLPAEQGKGQNRHCSRARLLSQQPETHELP